MFGNDFNNSISIGTNVIKFLDGANVKSEKFDVISVDNSGRMQLILAKRLSTNEVYCFYYNGAHEIFKNLFDEPISNYRKSEVGDYHDYSDYDEDDEDLEDEDLTLMYELISEDVFMFNDVETHLQMWQNLFNTYTKED